VTPPAQRPAQPEFASGIFSSRAYNVLAWATVAFVVVLPTVYLALTLLGFFGVTIGG